TPQTKTTLPLQLGQRPPCCPQLRSAGRQVSRVGIRCGICHDALSSPLIQLHARARERRIFFWHRLHYSARAAPRLRTVPADTLNVGVVPVTKLFCSGKLAAYFVQWKKRLPNT